MNRKSFLQKLGIGGLVAGTVISSEKAVSLPVEPIKKTIENKPLNHNTLRICDTDFQFSTLNDDIHKEVSFDDYRGRRFTHQEVMRTLVFTGIFPSSEGMKVLNQEIRKRKPVEMYLYSFGMTKTFSGVIQKYGISSSGGIELEVDVNFRDSFV